MHDFTTNEGSWADYSVNIPPPQKKAKFSKFVFSCEDYNQMNGYDVHEVLYQNSKIYGSLVKG